MGDGSPHEVVKGIAKSRGQRVCPGLSFPLVGSAENFLATWAFPGFPPPRNQSQTSGLRTFGDLILDSSLMPLLSPAWVDGAPEAGLGHRGLPPAAVLVLTGGQPQEAMVGGGNGQEVSI